MRIEALCLYSLLGVLESLRKNFAGSRIIKTGVAIFITAWVCELIGWPPVFAVITAIVTIEPTVSDSIKKGIIRFPASAIGSAYAVFFISLFGNSPITYTLAAVLTIATCFRFKLHAGLLVATLTSVAMVEVIHSSFLIAFFIRLGTTTVGLLVSTVVNLVIFPPDYRNDITNNIEGITRKTGIMIERIFEGILKGNQGHKETWKMQLKQLEKDILKTDTLIRFQQDEEKYHPLVKNDEAEFKLALKQQESLRRIRDHLDNLIRTPLIEISWLEEEREIILEAVYEVSSHLQAKIEYDSERLENLQRKITKIFWEDNDEITKNSNTHPTNFPPELIILYELISIFDQVENYYGVSGK